MLRSNVDDFEYSDTLLDQLRSVGAPCGQTPADGQGDLVLTREVRESASDHPGRQHLDRPAGTCEVASRIVTACSEMRIPTF